MCKTARIQGVRGEDECPSCIRERHVLLLYLPVGRIGSSIPLHTKHLVYGPSPWTSYLTPRNGAPQAKDLAAQGACDVLNFCIFLETHLTDQYRRQWRYQLSAMAVSVAVSLRE